VHYVVVNKEAIPHRLLDKYARSRQEPVVVDQAELEALGPKLVKANLLHREDFVRHHPGKLGKTLLKLMVI
jgi:hypothetical protein